MKQFLKRLLQLSPVALTKNQRYDRLTQKVIRRVCRPESNCVDVGCHKGEIMDLMIAAAPAGHHYGFEPIPAMYEGLVQKYPGSNISISNTALSNKAGLVSFNYVISNPAYSGLLKRSYDRPSEQDTLITVATDRLDDILPKDVRIDLIKIDVEGAELLVLEGAVETIRRGRPVIIFEHGLGASDVYGTTPEAVFAFFGEQGYRISLLEAWLGKGAALDAAAFADQFHGRKNHYFVAYPAD